MLKKLGKLLKYEFRFYFRILPSVYLLLILAATLLRFRGITLKSNNMPEDFLLIIVFGAIIIAMFIITIILIIQRYTDNFMKGSGSLMFSLPVTVFALLASKVIAAFCMIMIGSISIMLSAIINTIGTNKWEIILNIIKNTSNQKLIFSAAETFSSLLLQICLIYAVITASYMLPRFRNQAASVMYFLVMFIIYRYTIRIVESSALDESSLILLFFKLVFSAILFCVTWFLLKRSYNLE